MKNKLVVKQKYNVPSLQELYSDKLEIVKQNKLNLILNSNPKKEWIKIHPITKQSYIPIERQEYLMTMIFGGFNLEVKQVFILANSVVAIVRVHAKNPITGISEFQDGVGAVPIQIKKGTGGAIDFANMNSNSIQIGAPSAESYAFKDAVEKWGKIFGKDINRKDNINYVDRIHEAISSLETFGNPNIPDEIREKVLACTNENQLKEVWEENKGLGKDFAKLVTEHKKFLLEVIKNENAEV